VVNNDLLAFFEMPHF